ncbi:MAG: non-homologous end-joining DNA ligase [Chloroflexi bacterium]|nr:non-homologous end-joining DNA ligase [Chloroflexota bacterium]MBV9599966.1 non-homologous end-joining DNA ligase [Chloroflexota bacterium]
MTDLVPAPDPLRITHPDRVYWPAREHYPAITKRELLEYFAAVSAYVLPHLRDRPLTLRRFPTGTSGKRFYQKHVEFPLPSFVDRALVFAEEHAASGYHVICNNVETLLWLAQIGNLELHPWYSRINPEPDARRLPTIFSGSVETLEASVLNYPDFMVFDLDPYLYSGAERGGEEPELHREGFARACTAARWLKTLLDELDLRSFVKTSGKSGLHVLVPILREFDHDTVRRISAHICRYVLEHHPESVTMEWSVDRRRGKVFLDHNQNTRGKTLASPYSPRALPGAPVSMPVAWAELDDVYPTDFRIATVGARLADVGDIWSDLLECKNDLGAMDLTSADAARGRETAG